MIQKARQIAGMISSEGPRAFHARSFSVTWGRRSQVPGRQWKVSQ